MINMIIMKSYIYIYIYDVCIYKCSLNIKYKFVTCESVILIGYISHHYNHYV